MQIKLFIILILLSISLILNPVSAACATPSSFPTGVVNYACITFQNNQAQAVNSLTPIRITVNALNYTSYITSTLNNTVFFLANGMVVNSFIEGNLLNLIGNANALSTANQVSIFLQTPATSAFLGANTGTPLTNTIYIGFAGTTITTQNNLWTTSTGGAGYLTNTIIGLNNCNKYDSGSNTFSSYNTFCSLAALPAGWAKRGSTVVTFLSTNIQISASGVAGAANTVFFSIFNGLPYSYNTPGNSIDAVIIFTPNSNVAGWGVGSSVTGIPGGARWTVSTQVAAPGTVAFETNGKHNVLTPNAINANTLIYTFDYFSSSSGNVMVNYNTLTAVGVGTAVNPLVIDSTLSANYLRIGTFAGSSCTISLYYIRTRILPPGTIMPSFTFGAVTSASSFQVVANPNPPQVTNAIIDVGQITSINTILTGGLKGYTSNWFWIAPNGMVDGTKAGNTVTFTIDNTIPANIVLVFNAVSANQVNLQTKPNSIAINVLNTQTANNALGVWTINAFIVDSNGLGTNVLTTSGVSFTVNPTLVAGAITPAAPSIDSGQSITLTANPSGGTTTYSYIWYSIAGSVAPLCDAGNTIAGATSSTYSASPTATNTYTYKVTDSATVPVSKCSAGDTVTVNPDLAIPTISPSTNVIYDNGQTIVIASYVTGGTSPYTYNFLFFNSVTNAIIANQLGSSNSFSFASNIFMVGNTFIANVAVTDSAFAPLTKRSIKSNLITVNSLLVAGAIIPTAPIIIVGASQLLTSNPSGGTTAYSYAWYTVAGSSSPICDAANIISGATSSTYTASPTSTNTYSYKVTDSATTPTTACSSGDILTVSQMTLNPDPPIISNVIIDVGQITVINTIVTGGMKGLTANWFWISPNGMSGGISSGNIIQFTIDNGIPANLVLVFNAVSSNQVNLQTRGNLIPINTLNTQTTNNALGVWKFNVLVGDINSIASNTLRGTIVSLTINPAMSTPTISPSTAKIYDADQQVTIATYVTGGTTAYTYNFLIFNSITNLVIANQLGSTNSFTFTANTFMVGNTYKANVAVTDSASTPVTKSSANSGVLSFNSALSTPTISPSVNTIYDNGQSIVIASYVTGGTSPLTYNFLVFNSITNTLIANQLSTSNSFTFSANTFMVGNTFRANVLVTDSATTPNSMYSLNSGILTINSLLVAGAITPSSPSIDNGQSIILTSHPAGGTTAYSYQWYTVSGATNPICDAANVISGATSSTYSASPTSTNSYNYKVTDSATTPSTACSALDTITVNPALGTPTISPSANTIYDVNQNIIIATYETGGTIPYTYNFLVFNSITNVLIANQLGSSNSFTFTANTFMVGNTYRANVAVTDSAASPMISCSVNSGIISVNSALSTPTISPSVNTIYDVAQQITIASYVTGGTLSYTYNFLVFNSITNVLIANQLGSSNSFSFASNTFMVGNTYAANVLVTDSATTPNAMYSAKSGIISVNSALNTPTISPSTNTIYDNGQIITIASYVSGGTSPYTYNFLVFNSVTNVLIANQLGSTNSFSFASNTFMVGNTYAANVAVTDSATIPVSTCSINSGIISVNSALGQPTISPSANTIYDVGQTITIASFVSGGTSPYTYNFLVFNSVTNVLIANQLGSSNSFGFLANTFMVGNKFRANLIVKDSATTQNTMNSVDSGIITVNSALVSTGFVATSPVLGLGQTQILTATITGGTSGFTYNFLIYNAFGLVTNILVTNSFSQNTFTYVQDASWGAGTFTANLFVTDSASTKTTVSNTLTYLVATPLSAHPDPPKVSNVIIDVGQITVVNSIIVDGMVGYTSNWFWIAPNGISGGAISGNTVPFTISNAVPANIVLIFNAFSSNQIYLQEGLPSNTNIAQNTLMTLTANNALGVWTINAVIIDSNGIGSNKLTTNAITFTLNPALVAGAPTASNAVIDVPQVTLLTSHASGGTPSYTYQWYTIAGGSAPLCNAGNAIAGATSSTYIASPTSTNTYTYQATDSASTPFNLCSSSTTITVNPDLDTPTISPSANTIYDVGQTITIASYATGGTSPYTYNFIVFNSVTNAIIANQLGSSNSFGFLSNTFMVGNTFRANVAVTDSAATPVTKRSINSGLLTINSLLVAGAITPSAPTIDSGQSILLTSNPSGGTTPYTYLWYTVAGSSSPICDSANVIIGAVSSTYSASPTSTNTYSYKVVDSATTQAIACSAGDTVTVSAALSQPTISPSANTIYDVDQSITIASYVTGGTSPLSYNFLVFNSVTNVLIANHLGTSNSFSFLANTFMVGNTYRANVSVTDSAFSPVTKNSINSGILSVNSAMSTPTISPSVNIIYNVGQTITIDTYITGGTSPYTYNFLVFNSITNVILANQLGASNSFGFIANTFMVGNTYRANVTVTDSATTIARANSVNSGILSVNAALLGVSIIVSNAIADQSQYETFTYTISGGTSPYTYNFIVTNTGSPTNVLGNLISTGIGTTSSTFTFQLPIRNNDLGTITVSANVFDSATTPTNALMVNTFTVNALPRATLSPSNILLDTGQTLTYTITSFNGVGNFDAQLFNVTGNAAQGSNVLIFTLGGSNTVSFVVNSPTTNNNFQYNAIITDKGTSTKFAYTSSTNTVTVNPFFKSTLASVTNSPAVRNQYQVVTSTVSGGTAPYTYNFLVYNSVGLVTNMLIVGNSITSNSFTFLSNNAWGLGLFRVNVFITDSATTPVTVSDTVSYTVVNGIITLVSLTSTNSIAVGGQTQKITYVISGGQSPFTYNFVISNTATSPANVITNMIFTGCTLTTNSFTFTIPINDNALGTATISANVYDSTGTTIVTTNTFTIYKVPTITLPATPSNSVSYGTAVTVNVLPLFGSGSFTYQWTINNQNAVNTLVGSGSSNILPVSKVDTYTYNVIATDTGLTTPYILSQISNVIVINGAFPSIYFPSQLSNFQYTCGAQPISYTIVSINNEVNANAFFNNVPQGNTLTTNSFTGDPNLGTYNTVVNSFATTNYFAFSNSFIFVISKNSPVFTFPNFPANHVVNGVNDIITANIVTCFNQITANAYMNNVLQNSFTTQLQYLVSAAPGNYVMVQNSFAGINYLAATSTRTLQIGSSAGGSNQTLLNVPLLLLHKNGINLLAIMLALLSIGLVFARALKHESIGNRWVVIDFLAGVVMFFAFYFWWFPPTSVITGTTTQSNTITSLNFTVADSGIPLNSYGFTMSEAFIFLWIVVCVVFTIKDFLDFNVYHKGESTVS